MERATIIVAVAAFIIFIYGIANSITIKKQVDIKKSMAKKSPIKVRLIDVNRYRRPDRFYNRRYLT